MQISKTLSITALALTVSVAGMSAAHASAAAASTPASAPTTTATHTAVSHPRPDAVTVPAQDLSHFSHLLNVQRQKTAANQTSTNWSGYASNGSTYTTVTSSWVEPSVSCTADGIVAFWIGLDGWGSTTVEQDGTGVDCSGGSPVQFAWWETYPANSIQEYSNPVSAGDSITSTVTSEGGGRYDMVLTDSTRGWTENNTVSASGAQNASAEIIAEAVSNGSSVTPLPNFGSIHFTGSTIDNESLQSAGASGINMTNSGGTVIATTGPADANGDFTVSYGNTVTGNTVTVTNPGSQSTAVGGKASLQISGTDSGGATLSYTATGLPTGATISKAGLISGTLSAAGTYSVTVTATDSTGASGSATFTWKVTSGTTGNTVTVTNPGSQSTAVGTKASLQISGTDSGGATLSYTATGLPTGATISKTGLISGTLSTAGAYSVTVTATDTTGASGSASFTWTVTSGSGTCTGLTAWSATTSYVPGNVVSYSGDKYTSTWYSTGAVPSAPGSWAVWTNNGAC